MTSSRGAEGGHLAGRALPLDAVEPLRSVAPAYFGGGAVDFFPGEDGYFMENLTKINDLGVPLV